MYIGEEHVEEQGVEQDGGEHYAVGGGALRELELDQHLGQAEADDPHVEAHAYAAKGLGIETPDEQRAERDADQHAHEDGLRKTEALRREHAEVVVHRSREQRLGDADEGEAGAEILLDQSLVVEEQRERRAGNGGDRVEKAQRGAEGHADQAFRAQRPTDPRRLDQNERQQQRIGSELGPARMDRGEQIAANRHSRRESDEYRVDAPPHRGNARAVDKQHVQIDEYLDQHQRWIEDAVTEEQQPHRHAD